MSTTPREDEEATSPETKPGWRRYKLPVNRNDRTVHRTAPPSTSEPKPKTNTLRAVLIILGVLVLIPLAGFFFFYVALWGIR